MRYFTWRQLQIIVTGKWERFDYLKTIGHLKLREDAASGRDVNAMFEVACLALIGDHRISSDTEGWLQAAADRDHAGAFCVIGYLNEFGIYRQVDHSTATTCYERSSLLENPAAQYRLAYHILERGRKSGEYTGFSRWCQKSAAKNDPDGQFLYGIALRDGLGCLTNYSEAENWLKKSAEGANSDAMKALAEMYRTGHGVERNIPLADYWLMRLRKNVGQDGHDDQEHTSGAESSKNSAGGEGEPGFEEARLLKALKSLIMHEESRLRTIEYYSKKYPNFTALEILQKIFADYERDRR